MYNIKVNILAIDYGTKFLGTALGNLELKIPKAHKTIINKSKKDVIEKIKEIITKENVKLVILGIPEVKNPEKSWIFIKILEFALSLKREFEINLFLINEEYTTKFAKERFKKRGHNIHSSSAILILENFFKLKC